MRRLAPLALLALCLVLPVRADAAVITVSLGDYDGPANSAGFPIDLGVVDTFNYAIPVGSVITSASFSGTYGTQQVSQSTAGFDVEIEGATLTVCVFNDPGCWQGGASFRPFSFALPGSTFAGLLDGSADLHVIQTSATVVRLGTPTLTINYRAVPEPASVALFGLSALGMAIRRRLRG